MPGSIPMSITGRVLSRLRTSRLPRDPLSMSISRLRKNSSSIFMNPPSMFITKRRTGKGPGTIISAERTSSNFSYRMARYEYEESSLEAFMYAEKLNRTETHFNFTGYREISLRTRLFLEAEYGFFDFENPENQKNSKSYSGYGGFEFSPLGKIKGRVK